MADLIREKLLDEENPNEYKKGITYVTLDRLDFYAEFATKILLDKIYFYEHFHPEKLIRKGIFSDISIKEVNEFFIPIDINITIDGINYSDNLNWDILNNDFTPENFAEIIIKEQKLNKSFIMPISYKIRRGIHYYVYNLFKNFANNYEKYIGEEKFFTEGKQMKNTRHSDDVKKYIPTFLFDAKLTDLLGKKRNIKRSEKEEDNILPGFLKNKKHDNNVNIDCKETKNNIKSSKKNEKKKGKNRNFIEHDKQSTTVEECEEKEII